MGVEGIKKEEPRLLWLSNSVLGKWRPNIGKPKAGAFGKWKGSKEKRLAGRGPTSIRRPTRKKPTNGRLISGETISRWSFGK